MNQCHRNKFSNKNTKLTRRPHHKSGCKGRPGQHPRPVAEHTDEACRGPRSSPHGGVALCPGDHLGPRPGLAQPVPLPSRGVGLSLCPWRGESAWAPRERCDRGLRGCGRLSPPPTGACHRRGRSRRDRLREALEAEEWQGGLAPAGWGLSNVSGTKLLGVCFLSMTFAF